jgi:MraZ protein
MFIGRYEHTIDRKGRVSIPVKFREILTSQYDGKLIVTTHNSCLYAYPTLEWQALNEKFKEKPQFSDELFTSFMHAFTSGANECPIDGQGRILIPNMLRDYAALETEVIFVGMSTRIEIWNKAKWVEEFRKSVDRIQIPGALNTLGL